MRGKSHAAHPGSPSAGRFDGDARQTRERLLALDRRSGLRERNQETGDNTPWADALEEMQDGLAKAEVLAARELLLGRLKALSRAEEKVREGTYGVCDLCGNLIPAGRLKALPEAIHCVPCAERLEEQRKTEAPPILWMAEAQLAPE